MTLTPDLAARFARIALGHVTREYPHKADHVMDGPEDIYTPRALHPVFYGSFDWHSCVHGYWLLVRLRRLFPDMAEVSAITALIDAQFTPEAIEAECAYLRRPSAKGFERPYGWAWLLKLAAELRLDPTPEAARWSALLAPLSDAFVARFMAFLPIQTYPIRTGTHFNTAFALTLAADYARVAGDEALLDLLRIRARVWFGDDRDAPAWEPSGDDFLSGTLCAAQALRALLPPDDFAAWFNAYLPRLSEGQPAVLLTPATISDRSDGKIAHLDGLNLSRAWAWRGLLSAAPEVAQPLIEIAIDAHLEAALSHVAGDYMGEHWLASFALLALSES